MIKKSKFWKGPLPEESESDIRKMEISSDQSKNGNSTPISKNSKFTRNQNKPKKENRGGARIHHGNTGGKSWADEQGVRKHNYHPSQKIEIPSIPFSSIGRPSKLTEELLKEVQELVIKGYHVKVIADFLKISRDRWYDWMQIADTCEQRSESSPNDLLTRHEQLCLIFRDTVNSKQAEAEMRALDHIQKGGRQWTSRAWFLERKFPDRWGQRKHVTMDATVQATVEFSIDELLDDISLDAKREILEAIRRKKEKLANVTGIKALPAAVGDVD